MSINNSFDGFTAGALLSAAMQPGNQDEVYNLYKSLKNNSDGPPAPDVISFIEARIGKQCEVAHASHRGIVHGVNMASCGFYPGSRYPIFVKITDSSMKEAIGDIYEYDLEQVKIYE